MPTARFAAGAVHIPGLGELIVGGGDKEVQNWCVSK